MTNRKVRRVYCYFAVQIGNAGANCIDLTIDETKHKVEMTMVQGGVLIQNKRQNMDTFVSQANIKYALLVPEDPDLLAANPPMQQSIQVTPQQMEEMQAKSRADNARQADANKESSSTSKEEEFKKSHFQPAPTPAASAPQEPQKRFNKAVTGRPAGV